MLCCVPALSRRDGPHLPWFTLFSTTLALLFLALEWWFLALPRDLQDLTALLSRGRIAVDPDQGFFHPVQVWTTAFFHDGWWQGLPLLVAWLAIGGRLERQWGSLRTLALALVVSPIPASMLLIAGGEALQFGLAPLVMGAGGALYARDPSCRLRWSLWYMLPWAVGWRRLSSSLLIPMGVLIIYEGTRSLIFQESLIAGPLMVSVLLLCALASHLLVSSLESPPDQRPAANDAQPSSSLAAMAKGQLSLDALTEALRQSPSLTPSIIEALAARCLAERHATASEALYTHLCRHYPSHPACATLHRAITNAINDEQNAT